MAETFLLAIFLLFVAEAKVFYNCDWYISCDTLTSMKYQVQALIGRFDSIPETENLIKRIEEQLPPAKENLLKCLDGIQNLKTAIEDVKTNPPGGLAKKLTSHFSQSLIREREKSAALEKRFVDFERELNFNIGKKFGEFEASEEKTSLRLREIGKRVEEVDKENEEEFRTLLEKVEEKAKKFEFDESRKEVEATILGLNAKLSEVNEAIENFLLEKKGIIGEQKKSSETIEKLKRQIQELKKGANEMMDEERRRFSEVENSLRSLNQLLMKALNGSESGSAEMPEEERISALKKGINLLKESGGSEISTTSTSTKSEETFSSFDSP